MHSWEGAIWVWGRPTGPPRLQVPSPFCPKSHEQSESSGERQRPLPSIPHITSKILWKCKLLQCFWLNWSPPVAFRIKSELFIMGPRCSTLPTPFQAPWSSPCSPCSPFFCSGGPLEPVLSLGRSSSQRWLRFFQSHASAQEPVQSVLWRRFPAL